MVVKHDRLDTLLESLALTLIFLNCAIKNNIETPINASLVTYKLTNKASHTVTDIRLL
jgi:hypothetical protein